jgi:hypothetical protein
MWQWNFSEQVCPHTTQWLKLKEITENYSMASTAIQNTDTGNIMCCIELNAKQFLIPKNKNKNYIII